MNTFFTLLAALFCLLTLSNAMPPGTVATQCTVQVFGDLMQYGKGIRVSTDFQFPWPSPVGPVEADFGPDKAAVFLTLPILGTNLLIDGIQINFKADYMYDLKCHFSPVNLSQVNTGFQINTSLPGTGKCFRISQLCKHGISTSPSTYGTVYIDMWCDVPGYPFGAIKMVYNSQGPEVVCQ